MLTFQDFQREFYNITEESTPGFDQIERILNADIDKFVDDLLRQLLNQETFPQARRGIWDRLKNWYSNMMYGRFDKNANPYYWQNKLGELGVKESVLPLSEYRDLYQLAMQLEADLPQEAVPRGAENMALVRIVRNWGEQFKQQIKARVRQIIRRLTPTVTGTPEPASPTTPERATPAFPTSMKPSASEAPPESPKPSAAPAAPAAPKMTPKAKRTAPPVAPVDDNSRDPELKPIYDRINQIASENPKNAELIAYLRGLRNDLDRRGKKSAYHVSVALKSFDTPPAAKPSKSTEPEDTGDVASPKDFDNDIGDSHKDVTAKDVVAEPAGEPEKVKKNRHRRSIVQIYHDRKQVLQDRMDKLGSENPEHLDLQATLKTLRNKLNSGDFVSLRKDGFKAFDEIRKKLDDIEKELKETPDWSDLEPGEEEETPTEAVSLTPTQAKLKEILDKLRQHHGFPTMLIS